MPKTPMDYSKCSIYKIEHIENESLVYVGHTTNFNKRKGQHKNSCKNENDKKFNFKLYQMIRDNGGFDRFKMIEVEKYSCKDKREAERREDEIMKELKASMNTYKSFTTEEEKKERKKQYKEDNKEYIKEQKNEYMKEYYETNKNYYKEYHKEYRDENKEKIKQYRDDNKDKKKEYYETNKEIITKKLKEKITCKCGCVVTKIQLKRHERTKKHINLINPIQ
jgi:hypothetical protein